MGRMVKVLAWLSMTLLSSWGLLHYALQDQQEEKAAAFRILHRELSQKMAQHEAILSLAPSVTRLQSLKDKFPQFISLRQLPPGKEPGSTITPAEAGSYWLNDLQQGVSLRIDINVLFHELSQLQQFQYIDLSWQQRPLIAVGHADERAFWVWEKILGSDSQPLLLRAESAPMWRQLPWATAALLSVVWALLIYMLHQLQIQKRKRELADLRARFSELTRLNAMGEIAAGMVHELNQPLTAVLSYNQTALRLLDTQEPPRIAELLNSSVVQIRRIANLLTQFRSGLSTAQAVLKPVDMRQVWLRVEMLLDNEIQNLKIRIERHIPEDLPLIEAEPLWIEQIFHNLLSNAVQAQQGQSDRPRWVKIVMAREQERLCIRISDNGPGLSPEALQQVFIPFFTTRSAGLGLGMTLTETLIQRLHGQITVENHSGAGACFTLWLPLIQREA